MSIKLRRTGDTWKIDVTNEIGGDPRRATERADEQTRKLEQLTEDVKRLKFANLDQFRAALDAAGLKQDRADQR